MLNSTENAAMHIDCAAIQHAEKCTAAVQMVRPDIFPTAVAEQCIKRLRTLKPPPKTGRSVQPERRATRVSKYTLKYRNHFLDTHEKRLLNKEWVPVLETVRPFMEAGKLPVPPHQDIASKMVLGTSKIVRQWQAFIQQQKLETQWSLEEQWLHKQQAQQQNFEHQLRFERQQMLERELMLEQQRMMEEQRMLEQQQLLEQKQMLETSAMHLAIPPFNPSLQFTPATPTVTFTPPSEANFAPILVSQPSKPVKSNIEAEHQASQEPVFELSSTAHSTATLADESSPDVLSNQEDQGLPSSADEKNTLSLPTSLSPTDDETPETEHDFRLKKPSEDLEEMEASSEAESQHIQSVAAEENEDSELPSTAHDNINVQTAQDSSLLIVQNVTAQGANMDTNNDWEREQEDPQDQESWMPPDNTNDDRESSSSNDYDDQGEDNSKESDDDDVREPVTKPHKGKGKMTEAPMEESTKSPDPRTLFHAESYNSQRRYKRYATSNSKPTSFKPYVPTHNTNGQPEEKLGSLANSADLFGSLDEIREEAGMEFTGAFFVDTQGDNLAAILAEKRRAAQILEDKVAAEELAEQMADQYTEEDQVAEGYEEDGYYDDDWEEEEEYDEPDRY
jgi:hypothetical protein